MDRSPVNLPRCRLPLLLLTRTHQRRRRCSAAACGGPQGTTWTRWWNTVCCQSSTSETGSYSARRAPTAWVSLSVAPWTPHHHLCTMSYPLETGLRCKTLASPRRQHSRISHWSHISTNPLKQRLRCLFQRSCHQT